MSVAERLRELGVPLGSPARPLALYRPALLRGELVLVSGQLPMRDGALLHPGRVGDGVGLDEARAAARQCALNGLAAAAAALGSEAALEGMRVLRTAGYVAATPGFDQQPEVIDGASELLREALGDENGVGARAAIGVASLPRGACVEVEFLFATEAR
ncbi:MAG: RidA family protein [Chloroflexi bacterium]|nr:RidA family protein [Chloroflexota bacterium]